MGTMTADDFLAVRGVTVEWLEDLAKSVLSGEGGKEELAADANTVADLVATMNECGVSVPPLAALVKRCRGRPGGSGAVLKRDQVEACLVLLDMAKIPRSFAVELVAVAADLSVRDAYRFLGKELLPGEGQDWQFRMYLIEAANGDDGKGVLSRLLGHKPTDGKLLPLWQQFYDFLSVT
jgi:hypothetical protein